MGRLPAKTSGYHVAERHYVDAASMTRVNGSVSILLPISSHVECHVYVLDSKYLRGSQAPHIDRRKEGEFTSE